jgi:predicted RNA-binding protein with RPS1 domain
MDGLNDEKQDDSSSSCSESGDKIDEKTAMEPRYESSSSSSSSSASSSSESDESSDDDVDGETEKRTRGRRRRGLKDVDSKRDELNRKQQKEAVVTKSKPIVEESEMKKTLKSEDQRRCIGRKPLTDFVVGKRYTGTIQYIKPSLGLFIDIGCHSDAFCHISRSSDEYVESIENLYNVGDVLKDRVRVVDVDRKKKRITVSLQSDKKIEDEEKSQREYNQRRHAKLEKRKQKSMESKNPATDDFCKNERSQYMESTESQQGWHHDATPIVIDPETMTPAELKRARKLQRRQERRAAGIST